MKVDFKSLKAFLLRKRKRDKMVSNETYFVGVKGGVGTTTIAGLYAGMIDPSLGIALGESDKVKLYDMVGDGDLYRAIGLPVTNRQFGTGSSVIIDAGKYTDVETIPEGAFSVLVCRNDYASLAHTVIALKKHKFNQVVCVVEPDRPLLRRDVEHVIGEAVSIDWSQKIIFIDWSQKISRASDIGLLASQSHNSIKMIGKGRDLPPELKSEKEINENRI